MTVHLMLLVPLARGVNQDADWIRITPVQAEATFALAKPLGAARTSGCERLKGQQLPPDEALQPSAPDGVLERRG